MVASATRELAWASTAVACQVGSWRALAGKIPGPELREDALDSLARKRTHLDGAALFSILPRRRNPHLLRLLVTYEIALEFLDSTNERAAYAGQRNGRQLHLALAEALDPDTPISEYYRYHPWQDDGGYLRALVEACREECLCLPSYPAVQRLVVREATRAQVLALNHDPDPERRDTTLKHWAARELPGESEASWFELSAAATASLTIHALLALAAEPACTDSEISAVHAVYFPWLSLTTTMLDSYVDQGEDAANGDHSYIAHYPTPDLAAKRIRHLIQRSLTSARALPRGERHTLIGACMIAMYLTKDSARNPALREQTRGIADAGGSLTRALLPILRLWRVAYAQRSM